MVIEIAYVAPLATELGAARFVLPTTIAPRYHPAPANANAAPKPASATVPYARKDDPLEYDLGFTMTISSSLPLDTIVSPTHGIECDVATDYGMLAAGSASTKRKAKRRKQKAREEPRHVARVDLSGMKLRRGCPCADWLASVIWFPGFCLRFLPVTRHTAGDYPDRAGATGRRPGHPHHLR